MMAWAPSCDACQNRGWQQRVTFELNLSQQCGRPRHHIDQNVCFLSLEVAGQFVCYLRLIVTIVSQDGGDAPPHLRQPIFCQRLSWFQMRCVDPQLGGYRFRRTFDPDEPHKENCPCCEDELYSLAVRLDIGAQVPKTACAVKFLKGFRNLRGGGYCTPC